MIKWTAIADDSGRYELSANIDENTGMFYMPGLTIRDGLKEIEYWDNDEYLFGDLMDVLAGKSSDESISECIPESDFGCVLEILNEGIKMGFYEKQR